MQRFCADTWFNLAYDPAGPHEVHKYHICRHAPDHDGDHLCRMCEETGTAADVEQKLASENYSALLAALDRCEHGRHAADSCYSCPEGQSTGNLFLLPGTRIGTTLGGQAIIAPENADHQRSDMRNWIPDSDGRYRTFV